MKADITLFSIHTLLPKDTIPLPKDTTNLPPLPDGVAYSDPSMEPPPLPIINEKTDTDDGLKQKNYVPRILINELGISLGRRLVEKLPYEDNGRITFENLVMYLSTEVEHAKTDVQIIDKQIDLLFDMKYEARQAVSKGQTVSSRREKSDYIRDRLKTFDELANKASFNNRPLNKVKNDLKIGATRSDNIGNTRFETGANILEAGKVSLSFYDLDNNIVNIKEVEIGSEIHTGIGVLADAINDNYDKLKIKASWSVESTTSGRVKAGTISDIIINDVRLGTIDGVQEYDADGRLVAAINNMTDQTGIRGEIDPRGHLTLTSIYDGRGITVQGNGLEVLSFDTEPNDGTSSLIKHSNYGRLTLVKANSDDIKMVDNEATNYIGFSKDKVSESTINLKNLKGLKHNAKETFSIGVSTNDNSLIHAQIKRGGNYENSVTTHLLAIASLDILDSSILQLQDIRNMLDANKQTPIYEGAKTSKGVLVSKDI